MGAHAPTVPVAMPPASVSNRSTVAYLRALTGTGAVPEGGVARARAARTPAMPQVVAADRAARATAELRRARRAVSELVVALRAASAAGRTMEVVWLRRRLRIERLLFRAALAERRVWHAGAPAAKPEPERQP